MNIFSLHFGAFSYVFCLSFEKVLILRIIENIYASMCFHSTNQIRFTNSAND
jgi:hypothetical protein